jgi:hypothetical protein
MKVASTFRHSGPPMGLFGEFAFPIGIVEAAVGALILSLCRYSQYAVAIGLVFSSLFGFVCVRWWLGLSDCGCFGIVSVPPLLTGLIDLSLAAFLLARSYAIGLIRRPRLLFASAAAVACLGAAVSWADIHFARTCVVPVEQLIERRVDASPQVRQILLYDPSCAKCAFVADLAPADGAKIAPVSSVRLIANEVAIRPDFSIGCHVLLDGPALLTSESGKIVTVVSVMKGFRFTPSIQRVTPHSERNP